MPHDSLGSEYCGVRCGSLPTPADLWAIIRIMQGSWIGYLIFAHRLPLVSAPCLCTLSLHPGQAGSSSRPKKQRGPKSKQIAHGFADAMFAVASDGYTNITASLCIILEPKVLTIIICSVLNAKQMLGRDLWD
jgi:hypothetical protein